MQIELVTRTRCPQIRGTRRGVCASLVVAHATGIDLIAGADDSASFEFGGA